MKTFQRTLLALAVILSLGAFTPAEAKSRHHQRHRHHHHSSYNPLYGNYAAYHGGRGPTYGYWDRYYPRHHYRSYRSYRYYDDRPTYYYSQRPSFSLRFER